MMSAGELRCFFGRREARQQIDKSAIGKIEDLYAHMLNTARGWKMILDERSGNTTNGAQKTARPVTVFQTARENGTTAVTAFDPTHLVDYTERYFDRYFQIVASKTRKGENCDETHDWFILKLFADKGKELASVKAVPRAKNLVVVGGDAAYLGATKLLNVAAWLYPDGNLYERSAIDWCWNDATASTIDRYGYRPLCIHSRPVMRVEYLTPRTFEK